MIEVFFLALALSMDAFAVSLGLGAKQGLGATHASHRRKLAIMAAIYFGVFQGLMPLVGYFLGKAALGWVAAYSSWIAFILLIAIGAKMIYESFSERSGQEFEQISHKMMFILAVATSIDALAAGFALNVMPIDPMISCLVIALTTCAFAYAGVFIGAKTGTKLENKAELFGGIVLIIIGFKILIL